MHKKIRRNYKQYYDRNEIRYRPRFCIYKRLGDYVFIFETAYIKERFIPRYGNLHGSSYAAFKEGRGFDKTHLKGKWVFETALPKKEAFIDAL